MPSKSLYWHMFGSLKNALREAGFDVPVGEERLERAIEQGAAIARKIGRLPKFSDWKDARQNDPELMSEWQVYRMLEPGGGAWATFQFLVRERLREDGVEVSPEGRLTERRRSPQGGSGKTRPRPARARRAGPAPRKRGPA